MSDAFDDACTYVKEHSAELTSEQKEYLYGAFKQATAGDAPAKNGWNPMAAMKQNAWKKFAGTSVEEAKTLYTSYVNNLRFPV